MNNKNIKIPKLNIKHLIFNPVLLILIILSLLLMTPAFAEDDAKAYSTISYGALSSNIDNDNRSAIIEQNKSILITDQFTDKATGKNRAQIITEQQTDNLSEDLSQTRSFSITSNYFPEFSIYNATTVLQNDNDRDGFYQTFSVIFDADINGGSNIGNVYAQLYLSHDGGPWTHYYTTDTFTIYNESEQDAYEVITTFRDSCPPGYYDVLIDLYQVGYSGIVATYSADNNSALFALPLESSNNDELYIEAAYIYHGGSLSGGVLVMLLTVLIIRLKNVLPFNNSTFLFNKAYLTFGKSKFKPIATMPHKLTPCKLNVPIPNAIPPIPNTSVTETIQRLRAFAKST